MLYNRMQVEQYLTQQPTRRQGKPSFLVYLFLSGIAALSLAGCVEQYKVPSQQGPLSRFQNPANVSEGEIEDWYQRLLTNSMDPKGLGDMLQNARR